MFVDRNAVSYLIRSTCRNFDAESFQSSFRIVQLVMFRGSRNTLDLYEAIRVCSIVAISRGRKLSRELFRGDPDDDGDADAGDIIEK